MTGSANPFVGPRPLEAGEPFWGRAHEIVDLDNLLSAERIVLLHSPSGAGKSSLLQAGLVPRLRKRFDIWGPTRVHQEPVMDSAVNRYALSVMQGLEEEVPERLSRPTQVLAGQTLLEYLEGRPHRRSAPDNVLWVFDQFEEVLTVDPFAVEAKREFFEQLGELLRNRRVWALFALREDHLAPLDPFARAVPSHFQNRFRIDLLDLDGARQAMVQTALQAGREFPAADHLVHDLATSKVQQADGSFIEQTGHHVEPVQLQVVCRRLWDTLPADQVTIEKRDLRRFGDAGKALASYYSDSVARLAAGDEARERAIREWFDEALVTAGGIRGQVLRGVGESEGLDNETVAQLLDTHLVRAEQRGGAIWYELAHDRLIAPVRGDNAAWRVEHLAEVQLRAMLWESQGRPPGLLMRDAELAAAERWADAAAHVNEAEARFLDASREVQAAAERERRQARRIKWLALIATLVGVIALWQWRAAERERLAAENLTRAAVAANLLVAGNVAEGNLLLLEVRRPDATPTGLTALHRALAQPVEAAILKGHTSDVTAATWSPGGELVLTASFDNTARVWEANSGETLALLAGHEDLIQAAAWNPDGTRVATGSWDHTARIWDAATGRALHVFVGHTDYVLALAWSPDGRQLATAAADGTVRIWDAVSGANGAVLPPPPGVVNEPISPNEYVTVAWSPDGRQLVANRGSKVVVWGVAAGASGAVLAGHTDAVLALAWSPDGRRLATASADRTARIWDVAAGESVVVLEAHTGGVADLAWSPDGRHLATASQDKVARIWDAITGRTVARLEGHTALLWSIAWSRGGSWLATSSDDATVRLWRFPSGQAVAVLAGHGGQVSTVAWDPAGERLVTASSDATARIWQPLSFGEELATLWGHEDEVYTVEWSPDGDRAVTSSRDRTARVWNLATGHEEVRLTGHADLVKAATWSPDGRRVATASYDATARVWDARTGDALAVLEGHTARVWDVEWSPDGGRIATAAFDGTARIWDPESGETQVSLPHPGRVVTVEWSPDGGRVVTAHDDGTARIWDALDGEPLAVIEGHEDVVRAATWSPDGGRVLTVSQDGTGRISDGATGETTAVLRGHTAVVMTAAWSPDGEQVLTGSWDGTAWIWDGTTGESTGVLEAPGDELESVAWSPDGRLIVTAGHGRTIRLWHAESAELVATLEGHRESVWTAAWSADGRRLLTASSDGTARIWAVSEHYPDYLRGRIRGRLRRCLDPALYSARLDTSDDEAGRRHQACEACVPAFFDRLGDAPPWEWQVYEAAWRIYEGCFSEGLDQ